MPKPLQGVDWPLAQMLFAQGVRYRVIAEKVHVTEASLRQRSHRHGWAQLRDNALATVSHAVARSLSDRVRDALGEEIERQIGLLGKYPPTKLSELLGRSQGRAGLVEQITAAASKLCGWDRQQPSSLVVSGDVSQLLQVLQVNSPPANPLLEPVALAVPGTPATA